MTKFNLLIVGIACLSLGLNCNHSTPLEEPKPGRRDYIWTLDTLRFPPSDFFYPKRMWGSAPYDVWIVGFGSPTHNLIWHFDGVSWKTDSIPRAINPSALWGTASNNVWLGNAGSVFWRYDGVQWYKFCGVTPPAGFDRVAIEDIWGKNFNSLWGVGFADQLYGGTEYKGVIMYFNGSQWQYIGIPEIRAGFSHIRQQYSTGLYFLRGDRFESTGDTTKLYVFNGRNLQQIYSDQTNAALQQVRGEVYFIISQKIYKYVGGSLQLWKDFSGTSYGGRMLGRSELDFFGESYGGGDLPPIYVPMIS